MKILNGQEAFTALTTGQSIEARHKQATEFDSLDNFPATILVNPEYEFRISLTFITIGEMQVPEPIKEAPAKGTQCFIPSILTEVLSKSFKWKSSDSDFALLQRGQVHLVQEHAVIHTKALITISGGSIETPAETASDDVENKTSDESPNFESSTKKSHELLAGTPSVVEDEIPDTTHGPVLNSFALEVEQEIVAEEAIKHQEHLSEILNDVALANNPIEVNALVRYTKSWTPEQRQPVLDAINKRLVELNPPVANVSLSVRIQGAEDLTELDALEIDVSACDAMIQPNLMELVEKRRLELDPFTLPVGVL